MAPRNLITREQAMQMLGASTAPAPNFDYGRNKGDHLKIIEAINRGIAQGSPDTNAGDRAARSTLREAIYGRAANIRPYGRDRNKAEFDTTPEIAGEVYKDLFPQGGPTVSGAGPALRSLGGYSPRQGAYDIATNLSPGNYLHIGAHESAHGLQYNKGDLIAPNPDKDSDDLGFETGPTLTGILAQYEAMQRAGKAPSEEAEAGKWLTAGSQGVEWRNAWANKMAKKHGLYKGTSMDELLTDTATVTNKQGERESRPGMGQQWLERLGRSAAQPDVPGRNITDADMNAMLDEEFGPSDPGAAPPAPQAGGGIEIDTPAGRAVRIDKLPPGATVQQVQDRGVPEGYALKSRVIPSRAQRQGMPRSAYEMPIGQRPGARPQRMPNVPVAAQAAGGAMPAGAAPPRPTPAPTQLPGPVPPPAPMPQLTPRMPGPPPAPMPQPTRQPRMPQVPPPAPMPQPSLPMGGAGVRQPAPIPQPVPRSAPTGGGTMFNPQQAEQVRLMSAINQAKYREAVRLGRDVEWYRKKAGSAPFHVQPWMPRRKDGLQSTQGMDRPDLPSQAAIELGARLRIPASQASKLLGPDGVDVARPMPEQRPPASIAHKIRKTPERQPVLPDSVSPLVNQGPGPDLATGIGPQPDPEPVVPDMMPPIPGVTDENIDDGNNFWRRPRNPEGGNNFFNRPRTESDGNNFFRGPAEKPSIPQAVADQAHRAMLNGAGLGNLPPQGEMDAAREGVTVPSDLLRLLQGGGRGPTGGPGDAGPVGGGASGGEIGGGGGPAGPGELILGPPLSDERKARISSDVESAYLNGILGRGGGASGGGIGGGGQPSLEERAAAAKAALEARVAARGGGAPAPWNVPGGVHAERAANRKSREQSRHEAVKALAGLRASKQGGGARESRGIIDPWAMRESMDRNREDWMIRNNPRLAAHAMKGRRINDRRDYRDLDFATKMAAIQQAGQQNSFNNMMAMKMFNAEQNKPDAATQAMMAVEMKAIQEDQSLSREQRAQKLREIYARYRGNGAGMSPQPVAASGSGTVGDVLHGLGPAARESLTIAGATGQSDKILEALRATPGLTAEQKIAIFRHFRKGKGDTREKREGWWINPLSWGSLNDTDYTPGSPEEEEFLMEQLGYKPSTTSTWGGFAS